MSNQSIQFSEVSRHWDHSIKKSSGLFTFPVAFGKSLGHIAPVAAENGATVEVNITPDLDAMSGCSSGVEHNLAKVGVERSNRFTRSNFPRIKRFMSSRLCKSRSSFVIAKMLVLSVVSLTQLGPKHVGIIFP
jgi:hypothetical protein